MPCIESRGGAARLSHAALSTTKAGAKLPLLPAREIEPRRASGEGSARPKATPSDASLMRLTRAIHGLILRASSAVRERSGACSRHLSRPRENESKFSAHLSAIDGLLRIFCPEPFVLAAPTGKLAH